MFLVLFKNRYSDKECGAFSDFAITPNPSLMLVNNNVEAYRQTRPVPFPIAFVESW